MTTSGGNTNTAEGSAHVGVQANVVHGDLIYTVPPDATPEEMVAAGIRCLGGGMPRRAWKLLADAVDRGYVNSEVHFYWLLSLVSGRTRQEMSGEELRALEQGWEIFPQGGIGIWPESVDTVQRLIGYKPNEPATDINIIIKDFDGLGEAQQALILQHLEHFLEGLLLDEMWGRALVEAEREQRSSQRSDRVWKFFEDVPLEPRVRKVQPVAVGVMTWAGAISASLVLAVSTVRIGLTLAQAGRASGILAWLVSVAGGFFGVQHGLEWRWRVQRRQAKDKQFETPQQSKTAAPSSGFAWQVDQYFARCRPEDVDRKAWRKETAGILRYIRDEIVEVYRETKVNVDRISWLIRYRVDEITGQWREGSLRNYRARLAVPPPTRAITFLGLLTLTGGGVWALICTIQTSPLLGSLATVVVPISGWATTRWWFRIALENRRFSTDKAESELRNLADQAAFDRWREELADKPEEREIAAWLECDRKVLLNEALQHYKTTMSHVIAHAFIDTPAASTGRARVQNGPWRYLRYRFLVFLLTRNGVRQLTAELDFERGRFHAHQWINYRFEAISAVQVNQTSTDEPTFKITLVDGQEIKAHVTSQAPENLRQGDVPQTVADVTLDAAGFHHTLHVLEGIAAEGRGWIKEDKLRGEGRMRKLVDAAQTGND
ncbi:hypothetical protein [Frankia gtarii]|uniref:hypothetical protein n=1 Tax=Frankia gtarii TaxID=2950102 RepID=UPI0021BEF11A|nr:hypothetical protein [Frankia gtarii]